MQWQNKRAVVNLISESWWEIVNKSSKKEEKLEIQLCWVELRKRRDFMMKIHLRPAQDRSQSGTESVETERAWVSENHWFKLTFLWLDHLWGLAFFPWVLPFLFSKNVNPCLASQYFYSSSLRFLPSLLSILEDKISFLNLSLITDTQSHSNLYLGQPALISTQCLQITLNCFSYQNTETFSYLGFLYGHFL